MCVAAEQQRKTGYCPCGKPDDDFMITCDEQGCKYEWFHFVFVGLDGKSIPDGDWYCPECRGKYVFALFPLYKSGFPKENWDVGRGEGGRSVLGNLSQICTFFQSEVSL